MPHSGKVFSDTPSQVQKPIPLLCSHTTCAYSFSDTYVALLSFMLHSLAHLTPSSSEFFKGRVLVLSVLCLQHLVQSLTRGEHPIYGEVEVGKGKWGRPAKFVVLALWKGESTGASNNNKNLKRK